MTRLPNSVSLLFLSVALTALALACAGNGGPSDTRPASASITVFAAASLSEVFRELSQEFEARNPGVTVKLDLDGSQRLRSQLEFGAQADVFASADWSQMDLVVEAGLVEDQPQAFAAAGLVVIASNAPGGAVRTLGDLAAPGVRVVLAHDGVPVGAYSRRMLQNMSEDGGPYGGDFSRLVLSNLVSNESNVANVVQKVGLGEADAGIVYRPVGAAAAASGRVRLLPPPQAYDVAASYPIAVLRGAEQPGLAAGFVAFVLSNQGRQLLEAHGFDRPWPN